jgi:hypothetical protein
MDPKLIALIACVLIALCWAVVRSDRALSKQAKTNRRKDYDMNGHE